MSDSLHRALVSVRTTVKPGTETTIFARSASTSLGKSWSFDIAEPHLTGAETLAGLVANDVLSLFMTLAKKARVTIDEVEATTKLQLLEPLAHLGVIGSSGEPRYDCFQVRAFIGTSASQSTVQALWDETLRRAPLINTLRHSAQLDLSFQLT
jgi:hypothetical protein